MSKKSATRKNYLLSFIEKLKLILNNYSWIIFIVILFIGLYLRFYRIEEVPNFGWDQARDAFTVREIILGNYTLVGPKTGVGNFHLGPLYYYLLAPFYYVAHLDPMATNYFNIVINSINFIFLFVITKKIFNTYGALFVTGLYAVNSYLIALNQVPWNVTIMPGLSAAILYAILQVYKGKYAWVFITWTLAGVFFHVHFTAIFIPFIILASWVFVKDKWKVIQYSLLSIPLYLVWFIPNIVYELQNKGSDYTKLQDFLNYYYIGFHTRFFLHRLPEMFINFGTLVNYPPFIYIKFVIPLLFAVIVCVYEKDSTKKILAYCMSLWFIIPIVGFSLYGGPLSDYYFLYTVPMVLLILWYLQEKLYQSKFRIFCLLLVLFWGMYLYNNTKDLWIKKPTEGGLRKQKEEIRLAIKQKKKVIREETIKSYLYVIWADNKK